MSAYAGSSKNLKDLKDLKDLRDLRKDPGSLGFRSSPQNNLRVAKPLQPESRGIARLVALPHHPAKIPKRYGNIKSAETLRLFAWWQAVPEVDFFMQDWEDGAIRQIWHQLSGGGFEVRLPPCHTRLTSCERLPRGPPSPGVRVVHSRGPRRNKAASYSETGGFASLRPFYNDE